MTLHFATIFDINYLSRGLALHESITAHHTDFELYIICLDDEVHGFLLNANLANVKLIRLNEIEDQYPELAEVKQQRSRIDYIFTLSPYYPDFILKQNPSISFICSLDCDQYFFASCESILSDMNNYSVMIMPHRFSAGLSELNVHGNFNVSFQAFRNDEIGISCLEHWKKQCLEWCSDVVEPERYADQKYLDSWPATFGKQLKVIDHIGMGLAPWNIGDHKISRRMNKVFIDDAELILFHYQGLRILNSRLVQSGFYLYKKTPSDLLAKYVLTPVVNALVRNSKNRKTEVIQRNPTQLQNGLYKNVNSAGMFYLSGEKLIRLDSIYAYKLRYLKFRGAFSRMLKNKRSTQKTEDGRVH